MHGTDLDISIEQLTKVEGHSDLTVRVRDGVVEDVQLKITENKRFYTQACRNKPSLAVPQLVSRICGTCSIAHLTCATEAVEKALGIIPSKQTSILRKLTMYSLMIRDHALHLYFFVMPDMVGKDSVLDFGEEYHDLVHDALDVKAAGNHLSKLVAGRSVHAPYEQVGQFSHLPTPEEIETTKAELTKVRPIVLKLIKLMAECDFKFERETNFVSLATPDYSFLEGEIHTSLGTVITEEKFYDHLQRVVIPYSQATGFTFECSNYMVGALARMNLNRENLHTNTKRDAEQYIKIFPSKNIYHNNLAQAIEILHSIDASLELLNSTTFVEEPKLEIKYKAGDGIGVIEAPRGTLYYLISLNADGTVHYANLVIPTAQNTINLEADIKVLVQSLLDKPKEFIQHEIEKLIRAYDPCMSCSTHFLKVKWNVK